LPRTAGGFPLASAWRIARGQNRRRNRDVLELHRHGRRDDWCHVLCGHQGFCGLSDNVSDPFRDDRDRQRLDLSNDSGDLPRGEAQRGERTRRGRPGARLEGGESRGRCRAGIYPRRRRPRGFGASIAATGSLHVALAIFLAFYVTCIALTWWYYLRKSLLASSAPSLAEGRV